MAVIGTAELELLPNTQRFASKAEADVTPQAEGLGRKLGAVLGGALAVGGLYEFAKGSVEAFSEAQQGVLKLDSALKTNTATAGLTSTAFEGLNKKIMQSTTFNTEASQTVEGQLALYHLTAGQIKELTPLVEDYAARTGKDVTSAAKLAGAAILGKGRALKDVGIAFKDLKDPTKNYTELVGGLRQQVGGFASKEGQTFQGRMQILRNEFHEFQVEVGQRVVPILTALAGFLVTRLVPGVERLADLIGRLLTPVVHGIAVGFQAFRDGLGGGPWEDGSPFQRGMNKIGLILRDVVQGVRDFISGFTEGTDAIGSAQTKWAQWGAVVYEWVQRIERFVKANMAPTLGALGALLLVTVVPAFVAWAAGAIAAAVATVAAAAPVIALAAVVAALGFGIIWAYQHVQIFHDIVNAIADYFTTSFVPQMQAVGASVVDVWNRVYSVGKAVFDALAAVVRFFVDGPIKFLSDQIGAFSAWWSAHWDEIRAVFVFIFEAIRLYVVVWWDVLTGVFRVAMDIILPMVQVGWQVLQGYFHYTFDLIAGIVKVAWDLIVGIFNVAKDTVLGIIGLLLDLVTGHWGRAWNDIKATVSNVLGDISGTIGKVLGDIVNTIGNLAGDIFNAAKGIGHAIINGIVTGITSLVDDIGSAIRNVIGSAIGHLPGPIKDAVHAVIGVFGEGGFVSGPVGQAQLAVVHGGEFVLSNDMLRGAKAAPVASAGGGGRAGSVEVNVSIVMPGLATSPEAQALIRGVAQGEFASAMTKVLDRAAAGTGSRGG